MFDLRGHARAWLYPAAAWMACFSSAWSLPAAASDTDGPTQRIIVQYRDGISGMSSLPPAFVTAAAQHGVNLRYLRTISTGADVLRLEGQRLPEASLRALVAELGRNPAVQYAEVDRLLKPLLTPNDTYYSYQWHYYEAAGGLNLPAAWDSATGAGVVVAVLDTGYRPHVDLAGNIVGGYDMISDTFVSNDGNGRDSDAQDPGDWNTAGQCGPGSQASNSSWHGTHVAGTVAALTNNGAGVAGVAFGAKVQPVRVLGRCGGYTSDIADGIVWASGGTVTGVPANSTPAKVINLSLGGGGACDSTSQNAINSARSRGAVVIVAAGNENQNASNSSPANCTGVVTIAAVNRSGGRAYYSNYGTVVDVAAPGGDVSSSAANGIASTLNSGTTTPGTDNYVYYQGTSMATPHVAGVAALMFQVKPTATPDEIESTLKGTARAFPATCSGCGTGIVNAAAAVAAIAGGGGGGPTALANGVPAGNLAGASGSQQYFTLEVPAGATNLRFDMSGGTGDADLYVKFGSAPTTSAYDCRPYLTGNNESCSITSAQTGTYHVMINGYTAYSGVTLLGSYTATAPSACASGFTEHAGTLSGSGASAYLPTAAGYSAVSGLHSGRLTGPAAADFDLYLQQKSGSKWNNKASSLSSTSTESIDYNGGSGTYRWRVYSYSGSGSYTLCVKKP